MTATFTATKLLELLSDGKFHSGEALGEELTISRAAIWKQIQYLKDHLEMDIESISNKGYRLLQPFELLCKEKISIHMQHSIDDIFIFSELDSTNTYLMNLARQQTQQNVACFAEKQTHGKGRHGRHWVSPFGKNIYLSLLWNFHCDPSELAGLSLAVSVAIISTLKIYDNRDHGIGIKWPNDIYWQGKKLAGILIEMLSIPHSHCQVVIGVGLNVHLSKQHIQAITQPSVTLSEILQQSIERNRLAGILLNELIGTIKQFTQEGLSVFLNAWREHDILYGNLITFHHANKKITGIAQGISDKGELIVLDEKNEKRFFNSGEVTGVRKD